MMKNYKTSGALSKGKKHEGDSGGGGLGKKRSMVDPSPTSASVSSILWAGQ
jgi:hypothetical protein